MKLHKYTCQHCPEFYTTYEPKTDDRAAFCPDCGEDTYVKYIGEVSIINVPEDRREAV